MAIGKLAVKSGAWPLKEYVDGRVVHTRPPRKRLPVTEYLRRQGRFAHLFEPQPQQALLAEIQARIDELDIYSDERIALETREFAETTRLALDPEGRMILPRDLMAAAEITDNATFVGLGRYFQIWQPDRFDDHKSRQVAAAKSLTLPKPGARPNGGAQ